MGERHIGLSLNSGQPQSPSGQASSPLTTCHHRRSGSGMSGLFVPAEFAAMFMAVVAAVLGVLFAFPGRLRPLSPGSRVACLRLLVGAILAVDAILQFLPGAPPQLAYLLVVGAGQNQPALSWWYAYWASVIAGDPGFWWYGTGILMAILATCLLLGVARRLAYLVGFLFSLALWAIPNGFGGPYAAPNTDVGAGLLYAVLFLILLQMDSVSRPARWAADVILEHRWPGWRAIGGASLGGPPSGGSCKEGEARITPASESPASTVGAVNEGGMPVTVALPRDSVSAVPSRELASSAARPQGQAGLAPLLETNR